MAIESPDYISKSNVRIAFIKNNTNDVYFNLYGFLSDQGLSLDITNEYKNSLDLAGSFFGMIQEGIAGAKAAGEGVLNILPQEVKTKITEWTDNAIRYYGTGNVVGQMLSTMQKGMTTLGTTTKGYITTGLNDQQNIILNAPYYWQGSNPIGFNLSLYQIADTPTDIIYSYQRVMEILSPQFGTTAGTGYGQSTEMLGLGAGPGTLEVHYFPVDGNFDPNGVGTGTVVFGPCLCRSAKMEIKAPYSKSYLPIIGEYNFSLQTARILDRSLIHQLFRGSAGPLLPTQPGENGQAGLPWIKEG